MKRNKATVRPVPPVFKGITAVAPSRLDVLRAELANLWWALLGK